MLLETRMSLSLCVLFSLMLVMVTAAPSQWDVDDTDQMLRDVESLLQRREELEQELETRGKIGRQEKRAANWLRTIEKRWLSFAHNTMLAKFNYQKNKTDHNGEKFAAAQSEYSSLVGTIIKQGEKFRSQMASFKSYRVKRKIQIIIGDRPKAQTTSPEDAKSETLKKLVSEMKKIHGSAEPEGQPFAYYEEVMATSRDWHVLRDAWLTWRNATGRQIRKRYEEVIAVLPPPDDSSALNEKKATAKAIYEEILPLYRELHAYVRHRLVTRYQDHGMSATGPIPAHITGNMFGQHWENLYNLVKPHPQCQSLDVTQELQKQDYTVERMAKLSENYYVSLGLKPMTDSFWEDSMFEEPTDRKVNCYAWAYNFYVQDKYSITMCAKIDDDSLWSMHYLMGSIVYFMAQEDKTVLFRITTPSIFREVTSNAVTLMASTPSNLKRAGLLSEDATDDVDGCPVSYGSSGSEMNRLMKTALRHVACIPYAYLVSKYQWDINDGHIGKADLNSQWWAMSEKLRGVAAPASRCEKDFDAGAKYHIVARYRYSWYLLPEPLKYQIMEALCNVAGHTGLLHTCDVYGSKKAGQLLSDTMSLGGSRPWPDLMEVITGQREYKAGAFLKYYQPLHDLLKQNNIDNRLKVGW